MTISTTMKEKFLHRLFTIYTSFLSCNSLDLESDSTQFQSITSHLLASHKFKKYTISKTNGKIVYVHLVKKYMFIFSIIINEKCNNDLKVAHI